MPDLSPDDLSPLLFGQPSRASPFVGAVEVSSSPEQVVHGRGIIATRDVQPGECLFVTPPTVAADVAEVHRLWKGGSGRRSIEEVAEASLLKGMRRSLKATEDSSVAASFLVLTGDHSDEVEKVPAFSDYSGAGAVDVLLGRSQCDEISGQRYDDKDALLAIIRHNAFGPDFHNYSTMEQTWTASPDGPAPYRRVLGMYPLAAIINHSCATNAVRVFVDESMAVHASAPIKQGDEVVWSYLPPAQPYDARQEQIRSKYGFECRCKRCQMEAEALDAAPHVRDGLKTFYDLNKSKLPIEAMPAGPDFDAKVATMEELLSDPLLSNEARRSLRLGHANFYINYFNAALTQTQGEEGSTPSRRDEILSLATQLHFAFASFHNASTEHLSILHLCYELAAVIHSSSSDKDKSIVKLKFWTEMLKRAHMVRYGSMGNDVESVREAMKHSRGVLRNLGGLQRARWNFI